ncbi:hypothetical protein ACFSVN_05105 [Gracilimonas halophila]|uniref:Uncharacterized protein n=1 Tax=Gracilimonas halophila TaxID=1834464 RepID=A0ABW5JGD3_9BACT
MGSNHDRMAMAMLRRRRLCHQQHHEADPHPHEPAGTLAYRYR